MDEKLTTLTGRIVHVVFRNEQTFYTVVKVRIEEGKEKILTMTGLLPEVETNVPYAFSGNYVEHPRYGMQFQIAAMKRCLPDEREGVVRYLSGGQFPGIGVKTAEMIVEALGPSCLQQLKEDPDILKTACGLKPAKIEIIRQGLAEEEEGMQELVRFLNMQGIGLGNMRRLSRTYGSKVLEKLHENPYRVMEECNGFGFLTADKMARALGVAEDDPRRLRALLTALCMRLCMTRGNTYCHETELETAFLRETTGLDASFSSLLEACLTSGSLIQENDRIYPQSQFEAENEIAAFLPRFPFYDLKAIRPERLSEAFTKLEHAFAIAYDDCQRQAIEAVFKNPFVILTGGPGTGKTTVVRALVALFQEMYPDCTVLCAAPTGRAAKHLASVTGTQSKTIHALLNWDLETNTFGKNENDPLAADLLILDEFSMVDSFLFSSLLKASANIKRICIIGDEDQLPSVGPGAVLRDLIAVNLYPLIRLQHIYRQEEGSEIITLARSVHDGAVDFSAFHDSVTFFSCHPDAIRTQIVRLVDQALTHGWTLEDIQVLSPMYNGNAGIDVLNNALQEAFNPHQPGKKEIRVGYTTFRTGDKILQLKNQPDDDVYNGDIGILEEIYPAAETENHQPLLVVRYEDFFVEYEPETFGNIALAYCISIHKSQGNEYPFVIMPISHRFLIMLQKKLLYTGVTRAKKRLFLLGEEKAFQNGLRTLETHPRLTTLQERLQFSVNTDLEKSTDNKSESSL